VTLTDTHCHLDMGRFDADRDSVIERASRADIEWMLVPSLNLESAKRILDMTVKYPNLHAAIGFHPTEIRTLDTPSLIELQRLASEKKVVAIGEIGLDYYWVAGDSQRHEQRAALRSQLELAEACSIPVVLHIREQDDVSEGACAEDMLIILEDWVRALLAHGSHLVDRPGVLHSFAGTLGTATKAIDLGFYIGVSGPITYPKAEQRRDVVQQLPLERLLIETDAPFLPPQQHRGQRNEPSFVVHIADKIAEIQSRTPREVATVTSFNAARLFAWGERN
jgi:TatD DNase family protein